MAKQPTPGTKPSHATFVSPVALEKRVRRRLAADGLQLRHNRPGTIAHQEHGEWMVFDPKSHAIFYRQISLPDLARELGVLAEHETLVKPGQAAAIEGGAA